MDDLFAEVGSGAAGMSSQMSSCTISSVARALACWYHLQSLEANPFGCAITTSASIECRNVSQLCDSYGSHLQGSGKHPTTGMCVVFLENYTACPMSSTLSFVQTSQLDTVAA